VSISSIPFQDSSFSGEEVVFQSSNRPKGRMNVNSKGSSTSVSQASPVLPEDRVKGRATIKKAVETTLKPKLKILTGTSIIIAPLLGRSGS
ncbi:MAG: hypothetical protein QF691_09625, partial [SAR324 cluster bacterium]|nr:hypothetical protein [SAR324 cluster bacterium]